MVPSLAVTETQFTEQFKKFQDSSDDALRSIRKQAFRYFEENGYPSVRNENWKYTNVAPIAKESWTVTPVALTSSPEAGDDD
jgi:Fe-S cluster assembly protein SufD